jgi:hypothetical protein
MRQTVHRSSLWTAFAAALAVLAILGPAAAEPISVGAIQLIEISGGEDEPLRVELQQALRHQLRQHGIANAMVAPSDADLPRLAPNSEAALHGWIRMGRHQGAEAVALVDCRLDGEDTSIGLWLIMVGTRLHFASRLSSKRFAAAATLGQLVEKAATELLPEHRELQRVEQAAGRGLARAYTHRKRAGEEDPAELTRDLFREAQRRRNGGIALLAMAVPLLGTPSIIGLVRATKLRRSDDPQVVDIATHLYLPLSVAGLAVASALSFLGTMFIVSGERRMDRLRPLLEPREKSGSRPRLMGVAPLLDGQGHLAGLGARLEF